MVGKGLGNHQTEKDISDSKQRTSSLYADFTNSVRTLINSVAFHKETKYPEKSVAYRSCTSLADHLKSILRVVRFPKPFVLVLFSAHKILCVPYPEEYAQTALKHLFSLQNYSFF